MEVEGEKNDHLETVTRRLVRKLGNNLLSSKEKGQRVLLSPLEDPQCISGEKLNYSLTLFSYSYSVVVCYIHKRMKKTNKKTKLDSF